MPEDPKPFRFETLSLHGGQSPDPATKSRAVPIYQTTSYVFDSPEHAERLFALEEPGNMYTRMMNPTTAVFEERMALLEGGVGALAFSSGQAAITFSLLNLLGAGDAFVSSTTLYGGTYTLFAHTFPKFGIEARFVEPTGIAAFQRAIGSKTKALYVESVGNPRLNTADLEALALLAHEHGIPLVVDNTMPTPYLIRPIEHGADVVVHSATKFIGGHGTSIGGVVVDAGKFPWDNGRFPGFTEPDPSYHGLRYVEKFGRMAYILKARLTLLRDVGAALSPFNSFLFLQGLETLPIRMERHSQNAMKVAEFLEAHPEVGWVRYPGLKTLDDFPLANKYHKNGFGAIVAFGLKGGYEACVAFIGHLRLFSHLANIGDAKSLVIHPASTTHSQLSQGELVRSGVSKDFIRLSVGLEHVEDLLEDLEQAIRKTSLAVSKQP